jgi:hypothetical protein
MAQRVQLGALFTGGGTGAGGFLGIGSIHGGTIDRGTIDGAIVAIGDD